MLAVTELLCGELLDGIVIAVSDAVSLVVKGSIGLRLRRWYESGTGCHRVPKTSSP